MIVVLALSAASSMALAQTNSDISPESTPGLTQTTPADTGGAPRIPEASAANPQPNTSAPTSQQSAQIPAKGHAEATSGEKDLASVAGSNDGLKTAQVASIAVRFVEVQPANVMSSNLIGINVYNNQNESLGAIRDLVIDSNKLTGIVVNIGGFLGLGESYVVLDPSSVVLAQKDGAWRAYVDTSRDNLKNAPKFTYPKKT
jgi:sporulation protein YlmC with PRC-barrel domain